MAEKRCPLTFFVHCICKKWKAKGRILTIFCIQTSIIHFQFITFQIISKNSLSSRLLLCFLLKIQIKEDSPRMFEVTERIIAKNEKESSQEYWVFFSTFWCHLLHWTTTSWQRQEDSSVCYRNHEVCMLCMKKNPNYWCWLP